MICDKCKALIEDFEDVEEVCLTNFEKLSLMKANPDQFCSLCIFDMPLNWREYDGR